MAADKADVTHNRRTLYPRGAQTSVQSDPGSAALNNQLWDLLGEAERLLLLQATGGTGLFQLKGSDTTFAQLSETAYKEAKRRTLLMLSKDAETPGRPPNTLMVEVLLKTDLQLTMRILTLMSTIDEFGEFVDTVFSRQQLADENSEPFEKEYKQNVIKLVDYIWYEAANSTDCKSLRPFLAQVAFDKVSENGDTLLHVAAEQWGSELVESLLRNPEVNIKINEQNGWTPLHSAAAARVPDGKVADLLMKHVERDHERKVELLRATSTDGRDTALHIAARNSNVTVEFIRCLKDMDPLSLNVSKETPFHIAADADNLATIIALLEVFLPHMSKDSTLKGAINATKTGKSPAEMARKNSDPVFCIMLLKSLLNKCARNGNIVAVTLLIQHGIDPKGVLHEVVRESVRRPDKVPSLRAVYKTIIDTTSVIARWWLKPSAQELTARRNKIINLVEYRDPYSNNNMNVIELAISIGAYEMLVEIINTRDVFRFDREGCRELTILWNVWCEYIKYDVTNMSFETHNGNAKLSGNNSAVEIKTYDNGIAINNVKDAVISVPPKTSYLEQIIEHEEHWRDNDILKTQPFKQLTETYLDFVKILYFVCGIAHTIFMAALSADFLPNNCMLNSQFGLGQMSCLPDECSVNNMAGNNANSSYNATNKCTTVPGPYPNGSWLIWPILMFIYHSFTLFESLVLTFLRTCYRSIVKKIRIDDQFKTEQSRESIFTQLMLNLVEKFPYLAFCCAFFVWYDVITHAGDNPYAHYLEVTSVLFLFGWMLTFMFFSGVSKEVYIFSLVLREILIKDILIHFSLVFLCTVVGFGFAIHVLQQTSLPDGDSSGVNVTIYDTFLTAMNFGNLYDQTKDVSFYTYGGRLGFFRVLLGIYVSFTGIVLLNVLIAMLSNRYEKAKRKAESVWRYDSVAAVVNLRKYRWLSWAFFCLRRFNKHGYSYFCCCAVCAEKVYREEGRYYMDVRKHMEYIRT